MKTHLECIPCFIRQILDGARLIKSPDKTKKHMIDEFARKIPGLPLEATPPEIAMEAYKIIKKYCSSADPYKKIKQKSNAVVLKLYPRLKGMITGSDDRIKKAVELAIAGNVIDFGVKNDVNVNAELKKILSGNHSNRINEKQFHYSMFRKELNKSKTILYLADNAGEVVFDRILIEEIKRIYPDKKIFYAVKERPIINDALLEDAHQCGMDKIAQVITNGADAPGTILRLCSDEFLKIFKTSDMVISKGQGNFESLSDADRKIFFLFMAKCSVVAEEMDCNKGTRILLCNL